MIALEENLVFGGHLEKPQISCLFSKQAPAFFLSPTPYFLPQDFPSPWPAGEGPVSASVSGQAHARFNQYRAVFKQTAQEVREHDSTAANK